MKRRSFAKMTVLGMGAGVLSCAHPDRVHLDKLSEPDIIKPPSLKEGDMVGLIAPSSPFSKEQFQRAIELLKKLNVRVKLGKNLHNEYGYLAGSDRDRIEDLHQMFADESVKAIWCIRGGYGSSRILPFLDYELIKRNPKLLIGYSDVTALLQAIFKKTGLVGIHGPVAASNFTDYTTQNIRNMFSQVQSSIQIDLYDGNNKENPEFKPEIISPGKMEGRLAGGNLSLLAAMAGTEFQLDARDKLVFIEDVGEKPYRIDRMLTQLLQVSKLDKAKGILLGVFADCQADEDERSLSLTQTFKDRLGNLGIPVFYGFSIGHIDNMCSLPVGIKASFDTDLSQLTLLESVVS